MCRRGQREYTPIKNKARTKSQKDHYYQLLKKGVYFNVRFSFTDTETEEHTTLSSLLK